MTHIIETKLCYQSAKSAEFERLAIVTKDKEEYAESNFIFDLIEVTGIDEPTPGDKDRFVIFLKGTTGLLIKHNYKQLVQQWTLLKSLPLK